MGTEISYQAQWFECTYCRVPVCQDCLCGHDPTHESYTVCVSLVPPSAEVKKDSGCVRCNRPSVYGYSCQSCVYSTCRDCWSDMSVNMHEHRRFQVMEPPSSRPARQRNRGLCCRTATFFHCDFCQTGELLSLSVLYTKLGLITVFSLKLRPRNYAMQDLL
jgi:hypothetical protein